MRFSRRVHTFAELKQWKSSAKSPKNSATAPAGSATSFPGSRVTVVAFHTSNFKSRQPLPVRGCFRWWVFGVRRALCILTFNEDLDARRIHQASPIQKHREGT